MAKEYKNKLQRDEEAKKKAREAKLKSQTKARTNRMEELYKNLSSMSKEDIERRLEEIKKLREPLEKKLMALYTKFGQEKAEEIAPQDIKALKKLNREMKDLENFPKVKSQVEKILSVRDKMAQKKTANIEKIKKFEEDTKDSVKDELKRRKVTLEVQLKRIEKDLEVLNNKENLTPEERKLLSHKLISKNEVEKKYKDIEKQEKEIKAKTLELPELRKQDKNYDGIINKCNMAWRMLLEGKSWDEIELASIEDVKKRQAKKEQEETKPEETKPEETKPEETKPEETKTEETPKTFAEKHPRLAKIPGLAKLADRNAKKEEVKEDETKALTTAKFAEKHPRLAKIPGLAKLADKIAERKQEKESTDETKPEETKPEETEPVKEQRDAFIQYLRDMAEKGEHTEQGKYVTVEPKAKETEADKAPEEVKKEAKESER